MANKRDFKKYVTAVCTAMSGDMLDACYSIEGLDRNSVDDAIIDILKAGELAIMLCNTKFDKTAKAFSEGGYHKAKRSFNKSVYRKANKEFADAINAAVKKFNAAVPSEVKLKNQANA